MLAIFPSISSSVKINTFYLLCIHYIHFRSLLSPTSDLHRFRINFHHYHRYNSYFIFIFLYKFIFYWSLANYGWIVVNPNLTSFESDFIFYYFLLFYIHFCFSSSLMSFSSNLNFLMIFVKFRHFNLKNLNLNSKLFLNQFSNKYFKN